MKKFLSIIALLFLLLFFTNTTFAVVLQYSPSPTPTDEDILKYYQSVQDVPTIDIDVATVFEAPIETSNSNTIAVLELATNTLQPFTILSSQQVTSYKVFSESSSTDEISLYDKNNQTFKDFSIQDEDIEQSVELRFNYTKPITTSSMQFQLANNVSMPTHVSITAGIGGATEIIVNKQRAYTETITFAERRADTFLVTFYYSQPLRINEISFVESYGTTPTEYKLRFLARPNYTYQVFTQAQDYVPYKPLPESGNLSGQLTNIQSITLSSPKVNPYFQLADRDRDSVSDVKDNCPSISNQDQQDVNNNRMGDACEDFDQDGILNAADNCSEVPNRLQQDEDSDGIGDHCDGVESRWIEKMSFLPWLGIVAGFSIVIFLFKTTLSKESVKVHDESDKQNLTH